MKRDYEGHRDDKNLEDFSQHTQGCSIVEAFFNQRHISFRQNEEESIKKECFQYILSSDLKVQVITAMVSDNKIGQPSLVIEQRGVRFSNGHYSPGRIRGSKADYIFFVIFLPNKTHQMLITTPSKMVDYLNWFYDVQEEGERETIRASKAARAKAIEEWKMAYKIDSAGKQRIVAPMLVEDLVKRQVPFITATQIPAPVSDKVITTESLAESLNICQKTDRYVSIEKPKEKKIKPSYKIVIDGLNFKFTKENITEEKIMEVVMLLAKNG